MSYIAYLYCNPWQRTLHNPDGVVSNQRIQEIVQYLQNNCPTISGTNSPTMDSIFADVRVHLGCGSNPESRRFTRKHVYIHKQLVDA